MVAVSPLISLKWQKQQLICWNASDRMYLQYCTTYTYVSMERRGNFLVSLRFEIRRNCLLCILSSSKSNFNHNKISNYYVGYVRQIDCLKELSLYLHKLIPQVSNTVRTACFSKKSLGSDVGEIKKMSEKLKTRGSHEPVSLT